MDCLLADPDRGDRRPPTGQVIDAGYTEFEARGAWDVRSACSATPFHKARQAVTKER